MPEASFICYSLSCQAILVSHPFLSLFLSHHGTALELGMGHHSRFCPHSRSRPSPLLTFAAAAERDVTSKMQLKHRSKEPNLFDDEQSLTHFKTHLFSMSPRQARGRRMRTTWEETEAQREACAAVLRGRMLLFRTRGTER